MAFARGRAGAAVARARCGPIWSGLSKARLNTLQHSAAEKQNIQRANFVKGLHLCCGVPGAYLWQKGDSVLAFYNARFAQ